MNKKGFIFIETIVVIVVLSTALLIIYSSFNSALITEKQRLYYDDAPQIYKSYYLAKAIVEKSNLESIRKSYSNKKIITLGPETDNLFDNLADKTNFNNMLNSFFVYQLLYVDNDFDYTKCTDNVIKKVCEASDNDCLTCHDNFTNDVDSKIRYYIQTLGNNEIETDYLVIVYSETKDGLNNIVTETNITSNYKNSDLMVMHFTFVEIGEYNAN